MGMITFQRLRPGTKDDPGSIFGIGIGGPRSILDPCQTYLSSEAQTVMRIPFSSSSFNFFSMFGIFWNSIVRREISVPRIWVRSMPMLSFARTCTTDLTKLNTNKALTNTTRPGLVRNWPRSPANSQRSQKEADYPIRQTSCVSSEVQCVDSSTLAGKMFRSNWVRCRNSPPGMWSWTARDAYLIWHQIGYWIRLLNFW